MAILIGITIPVLPKVMDSARRVACSSNLRQIGISLDLYKDRNKLKYPVARYIGDPWLSGSEEPPLNEAIEGYLDSDSEIWKCPGDRVVYEYEYENEEGQFVKAGLSYVYITAFSGRSFEETFYARFLQRTPSDSPVSHDYDGGVFETQDGDEVQAGFFHSKRNVLYADSHVGEPE